MSERNILKETLARLHEFYRKSDIRPGNLTKVALKGGWNVVIGTNGQCGMALSFVGWIGAFREPHLDIEALKASIGKNLFDVASERIDSESWQERSICVAAMSALSQPFVTPSSLKTRGFEVPTDNPDFTSCLKPDDIAVIVGYGGGVERSMGKCKELHVLDMRKKEDILATIITNRGIEYAPAGVTLHPAEDNVDVMSRATAVSITGSTLVNGTFDSLIDLCKNARLISVYGASAGFIPDILFERGVHMIHSSRITDPDAFEVGIPYAFNMESVIRETQVHQTILNPTRKK
jgi:uncharacterized protein